MSAALHEHAEVNWEQVPMNGRPPPANSLAWKRVLILSGNADESWLPAFRSTYKQRRSCHRVLALSVPVPINEGACSPHCPGIQAEQQSHPAWAQHPQESCDPGIFLRAIIQITNNADTFLL